MPRCPRPCSLAGSPAPGSVRKPDFTSAHFLGLTPTGTPAALTTGRPAVEDREVGQPLARRLAHGHSAGDGVLARTSLHGLIDVLATRSAGAAVLLDEAIYPIGRWAAEAVGAEVFTFRHHDAQHAARRLRGRGQVVLVTDGLCGSCLQPAPLAELAEVADRYGGEMVVDDTMAAGVLGRRSPAAPTLGTGGAGTAAWLGGTSKGWVTVASLAKGLSAPLAVITGPPARIEQIRREGPTRVHASPPTTADVSALEQALAENLDPRRCQLERAVHLVRSVLDKHGLRPLGIPFPVVATEGGRWDPLEIHRALAAADVRSLATTGRCTGRPTLTLCLRADHSVSDLRRLEQALVIAVTGRAA